jgi:hypothetical protein
VQIHVVEIPVVADVAETVVAVDVAETVVADVDNLQTFAPLLRDAEYQGPSQWSWEPRSRYIDMIF